MLLIDIIKQKVKGLGVWKTKENFVCKEGMFMRKIFSLSLHSGVQLFLCYCILWGLAILAVLSLIKYGYVYA